MRDLLPERARDFISWRIWHPVPTRAFYGGAYELGADIAFAKIFLVD
jgi:hypothetical protein